MEDSFEGIFLNHYKFEKYIRGDSHCSVFIAVHLKTAKKVAIKLFFRKEIHPKFEKFLNENFDKYRSINHINILKIEDYFVSEIYGFLVYQYCQDRTLEDYWLKYNKLIDESKLIKIIRQIFKGFTILCEYQIYNRDYRLHNILIHDHKVKVGDSLEFVKTGTFLFQTQREYLSPEVLEQGDLSIEKDKSELWSLGVSLYKLVYGINPFQGVTDLLLLRNINRYFDGKIKLAFKRTKSLKFQSLFEEFFGLIFRKERKLENVAQCELLNRIFPSQEFKELEQQVEQCEIIEKNDNFEKKPYKSNLLLSDVKEKLLLLDEKTQPHSSEGTSTLRNDPFNTTTDSEDSRKTNLLVKTTNNNDKYKNIMEEIKNFKISKIVKEESKIIEEEEIETNGIVSQIKKKYGVEKTENDKKNGNCDESDRTIFLEKEISQRIDKSGKIEDNTIKLENSLDETTQNLLKKEKIEKLKNSEKTENIAKKEKNEISEQYETKDNSEIIEKNEKLDQNEKNSKNLIKVKKKSKNSKNSIEIDGSVILE